MPALRVWMTLRCTVKCELKRSTAPRTIATPRAEGEEGGLSRAASMIQLAPAEWAAAIACSVRRSMRKVRTGQGTVVANGNPARAEG